MAGDHNAQPTSSSRGGSAEEIMDGDEILTAEWEDRESLTYSASVSIQLMQPISNLQRDVSAATPPCQRNVVIEGVVQIAALYNDNSSSNIVHHRTARYDVEWR